MKSPAILAAVAALQVVSAQSTHGTTNKTLTFETTIHIDGGKRYQTMIGGGCSGAFGAACTTNTLSAADQQTVVETLFSENVGGLSVLRNLTGSSKGATILPQVPASPASPANYTSITAINNDSCQLTLAQTALKYNLDLKLYADAWSAPGGFKTTGQEAGGGFICGVRRSNCTGDWREAYADYLIEYVRQYQQKSIKTYLLGAFNELVPITHILSMLSSSSTHLPSYRPDFNPVSYSAMLSDGYQAYNFLSVLYPKVKKAFPSLLVSCCDSAGARQQRDLLYELNRAAGGQQLFDINTYHNYQSDVKRPSDDLLQHGQPTLETEWSDGGSSWAPTWDVSGNNFEGFQWAICLHNAFRNGVAGWLNWWCTWSGPDAPLIVVNGTDYQVAARLWALSGYFRFARPGAVRIDSSSDVEEVYVTAWENVNGTVAVPVINAAHYPYTIHVDLVGSGVNYAVAYLTDNGHNGTAMERFGFEGGRFSAVVEARSMKTWFLSVV